MVFLVIISPTSQQKIILQNNIKDNFFSKIKETKNGRERGI
jgi:hypothetical protein